jgi:glycosyltransferase involved in cell wall biosynthesis
LRHAVRSALWQAYPSLEVLVVGDATTDDSEEVAASFGDARVHWHNLPRNTGSQSGPNQWALENARGEWLAYLGQDDVWHPWHLSLLMHGTLRAGADFANTLSEMIGPPGSNVRSLEGHGRPGAYRPVPSVVHRVAAGVEAGGWRDPRETEVAIDVDFLQRLWATGPRHVTVPALTVFKFSATFRPNSYVEKPSFEQAEYVRRMLAGKRRFLVRELGEMAVARARGARGMPEGLPTSEEPGEPGDHMARLRRIKGLDELR